MVTSITRGSYANHAAEFGVSPLAPRWLAAEIVALDALLLAAVALRKRGLVRRIARTMVELDTQLTASICAATEGKW